MHATHSPATIGDWLTKLKEVFSMEKIIVDGIRCHVFIGVPDQERQERQTILVDLEIKANLSEAARKDNFRQTIDYEKLVHITRSTAQSKAYSLIEHLGERICSAILENQQVERVRVRVRKFPQSLKADIESVSFCLKKERSS
jgi:dihydroneopterin aldolase